MSQDALALDLEADLRETRNRAPHEVVSAHGHGIPTGQPAASGGHGRQQACAFGGVPPLGGPGAVHDTGIRVPGRGAAGICTNARSP